MKKVYIVIEIEGQTYQNLPVGTIAGVFFENEEITLDSNLFSIVDFNENLIQEKYLKVDFINDQWVVSEDMDKKGEDHAVEIEMKKMEYGKEILAYIGVLFNALTVEDYQTLLLDQEVAMIQNLLRQGAIESTLGLLDAYVVNAIVTQEIKDKIASKIASFIAQV